VKSGVNWHTVAILDDEKLSRFGAVARSSLHSGGAMEGCAFADME